MLSISSNLSREQNILKTALTGAYHSIDHRKYGHRYLAEFQYPSIADSILAQCFAASRSPSSAPNLALCELYGLLRFVPNQEILWGRPESLLAHIICRS